MHFGELLACAHRQLALQDALAFKWGSLWVLAVWCTVEEGCLVADPWPQCVVDSARDIIMCDDLVDVFENEATT
jgi:hypothetical protein